MSLAKRWIWIAAAALIALQVAQFAYIVHRESLTWDEDDHMFAGYMMWKAGDFGLNPEHPPLVKLLATLPLLGEKMWVPTLKNNRDFKLEAYQDGRDWLARDDGAGQRLVFRMRMAAGLLAVGLSIVVFFAAREWFGAGAALIALVLLVFDPNILGHSALVTTDVGVTLFFLLSIYAFYRYVKQPSLARLALAGIAAGLLLATKHSGILLAPMLVLLIAYEVLFAAKGTRGRTALRLTGAFAAIVVIGVAVLWAFYGFRYAARPAGLALSTPLADYVKPLSHFEQGGVMTIARLHLLPESYLMGLVDVKRMAQFYPTFILGRQIAHGVWWYFPVVIGIKTTLGLLALVLLSLFAILTRRLNKPREIAYILIPWIVYLAVAILSGMNIGSRHILPLYALAAILSGAGVMALSANSRAWKWVCGVLIVAHVVSALAVFPNDIAYANEAWGGPKNLHNLLSDANVDWAQQLISVKKWQDQHPNEECWFAYFAYPEVDTATYGIRCHHLPTTDTLWQGTYAEGGPDLVPPVIHGTVLLSAGDLSGCEWESEQRNPYRSFMSLKPDEMIDYGVMVYRGTFDMKQAAALSRAERAILAMEAGKMQDALALAREAVAMDPTEIMAQTTLGNAAHALGQKEEARAAWTAALNEAKKLEPDAQPSYVPGLEARLARL
jgi:4-amino-4-deoxy-L-arabinose transferase-like glycosyltransferase